MNFMNNKFLIMALLCFVMISCKKETENTSVNDNTVKEAPSVETDEISSITTFTANVKGNVTYDGGSKVTSRGVCWSKTDYPNIDSSFCIDAGSGEGIFECMLSGLESNTTYYVRAYAINDVDTSYGENKSFKTKISYGSINGYDWVDLGLPSGLKWATTNVGASLPEEFGEYYAWGEIKTKPEYTSDNCFTFGETISDFSGNQTYDVARKKWGSTWRIPTRPEFDELKNHCTWDLCTLNDVIGYKVTGPNGNQIFLPAAGYQYETSFFDTGDKGYYWTSTPNEDSYDDYAFSFHFNMNSQYVYSFYRYYGQCVRPISE